MNFIKLLPVTLSLLLLGAHFFRARMLVLVLAVIVILFMLLIRKPWSARVIQIVLVLGGIEWIRTAATLIRIRQNMGVPWERLALILGGVALVTICSTLVFRATSLRQRYGYAQRHKKNPNTLYTH